MFEKKNQGLVDAINTEFEGISNNILKIFDCNSVLGKEINPLLDDIDRRIKRIGENLDGIGLAWASKNTQLKDMKESIRKLTIMFNTLVKDLYEKSEKAKLKGKKFVVPENRAKALKEKWVAVAKEIKEKSKQAEAKKEKREVRDEKLKNLVLPLDFDSKEEAIVAERARKNNEDRETIVRLIAGHFEVKESAIRNWPDHVLISTAEAILKENGSNSSPKGQGPRFE